MTALSRRALFGAAALALPATKAAPALAAAPGVVTIPSYATLAPSWTPAQIAQFHALFERHLLYGSGRRSAGLIFDGILPRPKVSEDDVRDIYDRFL